MNASYCPAYTIIIPARMASTRLPNKPLADIGGVPMVVRVAMRAQQSRANNVVVAADDERILAACKSHGIQALLTSTEHPSGSDRLAQACSMLQLPDETIVVNVQGDEPLIDPALIDDTAIKLHQTPSACIATAAHPITYWEDYQNPNVVKVVLNGAGCAQYFSRAPIAYARDHANSAWWHTQTEDQDAAASIVTPTAHSLPAPLRHIGIYSYRADFLKKFPTLQEAPTEKLEALEQLRALWHGYAIAVHIAKQAPAAGVDTAEDLLRIQHFFQSSALGSPN